MFFCFLSVSIELGKKFSPAFNRFVMEKFLVKIVRPREKYEISSASYYTFGMMLMFLIVPRYAIELAVLVLAFGDPIASIVGKRFGKVKLWRQKTLEGSLGFVAAAFFVTFLFLILREPSLSFWSQLSLALVVSIVGALAELLGEYVDDNFLIPVACSLVACLWFM